MDCKDALGGQDGLGGQQALDGKDALGVHWLNLKEEWDWDGQLSCSQDKVHIFHQYQVQNPVDILHKYHQFLLQGDIYLQ